MKGKHAIQSARRRINNLEAIANKLKSDLSTERKKRIDLERKIVDQSAVKVEISRLQNQVSDQVSDKYLKLKKKYNSAKNTIAKLKSSASTLEDSTGVLIGMYAHERGITRTEVLDEWVSKLSGKEVKGLYETGEWYKGKDANDCDHAGKLENIRRRAFEKRNLT